MFTPFQVLLSIFRGIDVFSNSEMIQTHFLHLLFFKTNDFADMSERTMLHSNHHKNFGRIRLLEKIYDF